MLKINLNSLFAINTKSSFLTNKIIALLNVITLTLIFVVPIAAQQDKDRGTGVRKSESPKTGVSSSTETATNSKPEKSPTEKKKIIVVLDFDDATLGKDNEKRQMGKQIAILLSNKFNEMGDFTVVERQQLAVVFKQIDASLDERFDPKTAAKIGKATSASVAVLGTITEYTTKKSGTNMLIVKKATFSAKIGLAVRLVDVNTAVVLDSVTVEGKSEEKNTSTVYGENTTEWDEDLKTSLFTAAANQAVNKAVGNLVKLINKVPTNTTIQPVTAEAVAMTTRQATPTSTPTAVPTSTSVPKTAVPAKPAGEAKIASVTGAQVYVSGLGQSAKAGDRFNVVRLGNVIKDPDTGEVLDTETQQIAVIEVVEVRERVVIAKIVSGSGVKIKDIVKPLQ